MTGKRDYDLQTMSPSEQRALLEKLLRDKAEKAAERAKQFPMSAGQQGLWHAYRRDPQATAFNVFLPTRVRSPIDPNLFRQSIELLAQRHTSLRTTFSDSEGALTQRIHDDLRPEFKVVKLEAEPEVFRAALMKETLRPFDLQRGPLLRLYLGKLADDDWLVLATTHHIVVDFWSLVLILQEMRQAIPSFAAGLAPNLPAPVTNYATFVNEQANLLASERGAKMRGYWKDVVTRGAAVLEMPLDRTRPVSFTGRSATQSLIFPENASGRISELAVKCRATPFAVVHAALQVFLSRYTGQDSFYIGSPFSGRTQHKYEQTVGFFVNMLPLHADLTGSPTFCELINRTQSTLLDALEHEAYPISQIVHDAAIARDPSRSPLFQVSCTFEKSQVKAESGRASFLFPEETPADQQVWEFGGFRQESFYVPHQTCHYDLEFVLEQSGDRLRGILVYCCDLFEASSVALMAENFSGLLDSLLDGPDVSIDDVLWEAKRTRAALHSHPQPVLPARSNLAPNALTELVCTPSTRSQSESGDQSPQSLGSDATVVSLISAAEQRAGNQLAFDQADYKVTYNELCSAVRAMALRLAAVGVQRGDLVPVIAPRGPRTLAAILAVQFSGAAVVPIDAGAPSVDWTTLLDDSQAKHLICADESREMVCDFADKHQLRLVPFSELLRNMSSALPLPTVQPRDLAYAIYTSGSTGKPKGVLIEHQALCNTLQWRMQDVPLGSDRVLMLLSHQFDAGLGIALSTLSQGASLVYPEHANCDPVDIINLIIERQVTVLPVFPGLLRVLITQPEFSQCLSLRQVWVGGEALSSELLNQLRAAAPSGLRILNFYGPTEAAIEATYCDLTDHPSSQLIPIGCAIAGAEVLIVDKRRDQLHVLPDLIPGEIAIGGAGLARGYLNRPELTKAKFVAHPDRKQQRLYLTGDVGQKLANGEIRFLGRRDHQVKLHGYRIELGEIEAVAQSHPDVTRAAVEIVGGDTPQAAMVAFVTGQGIDRRALARFLAERLPAFKLPKSICVLPEMPLSASGKVDRKRLPLPAISSLVADAEPKLRIAPRTPLESYLAEAWCSALGVDLISVDANFFDAGGSSLGAATLTGKLTTDLGVHVPTALLFDLADIAQIALRLTELYPYEISQRFGDECVKAQHALGHGTQAATRNSRPQLHPLLAPLKPIEGTSTRPPIFMVHPPGGIVICYRELAGCLPVEQPLYGIRARGLHGDERLPDSVESMAADYVQAIRSVWPQGPYVVGGWSLGGLIAFEMAQQLLRNGQGTHLVMLDTTIPAGATTLVPVEEQVSVGLEYGIDLSLDQLGDLPAEQQLPFLWAHAQKLGVIQDDSPAEVIEKTLRDLQGLFHHHVDLARRYALARLPGTITLFRPTEVPFELHTTEDRGWRHLAESVQVCFVPGHHHSMVQPPHVKSMAAALEQCLTPKSIIEGR
ncbi:MAG: amino acid adenylation domain-containing protein [Pirellulaceae bacterium]